LQGQLSLSEAIFVHMLESRVIAGLRDIARVSRLPGVLASL